MEWTQTAYVPHEYVQTKAKPQDADEWSKVEGDCRNSRLRLPGPNDVLATASLLLHEHENRRARGARPSIRLDGPPRRKHSRSRFEKWSLG